MRESATLLLFFCVATLCCPSWAADNEEALTIHIVLELRDGSRLIGSPRDKSLPIETSYVKAEIPVREVDHIDFSQDKGQATIRLVNGDKLTCHLGLESLALDTVLGKLSVPLQHVRSADVTVLEKNWISKDAISEASSIHNNCKPLPSLLTGEGKFYGGEEPDKFAFHTKNEHNPHIVVDLRREK